MIKDDNYINFSGITHDHSTVCNDNGQEHSFNGDSCSTIAILRRHPMYDSLILVKKYRNCLAGYSLEFPSSKQDDEEQIVELAEEDAAANQNREHKSSFCNRRQLVSRILDGDDPMYQSFPLTNQRDSTNQETNTQQDANQSEATSLDPFGTQIDDNGDTCELVHVPINGLMDRLKNYTETGVAIDSRVYAFAMGLKTAERILTTNSMKELQETPI